MANLDPIQTVLEKKRESFVFSAYQAWAEYRGISERWSGGISDYWSAAPVADDFYFDLGSVTKSVVTASVLARAVDRGQVRLTDSVSKYVPEWSGHPLGGLALVNLLSHTAGLNAWMPFHRSKTTNVKRWLEEQGAKLFLPAAGRATYSDVGFWVLGVVIEKIWGGISQAFDAEVKTPLKLTQVVYGPISAAKVVSTEFRDDRDVSLCGVVFDENAEAMGGVGAHAGLFSTASGLAVWARAWLDARQGRSTWLSKKTAEVFTNVAFSEKGTWALGWDTKSTIGSSAGSKFSLASFGHLGYTGTSVWIDPVQDAFAILLTNRVHPSRLDERIRVFRPQFHDLLWQHWQGKQGDM